MSTTPNDADLTLRRKRLAYRAWHRGTLEMDQIMGHFADAHLATFDTNELARLETLMGEDDANLYAWIIGQEPVPQGVDRELLDQIIAFQSARART